MGYPGGKAGAGVYQRIINQIPPHEVYVEPFLGDGAVMRRKRPAARNIGVEIDAAVATAFLQDPDAGFSGGALEVHNCCGIEWLKHAFGIYRVERSTDAERSCDARSRDGGRQGSQNLAAPAAVAAFGGVVPRSGGPQNEAVKPTGAAAGVARYRGFTRWFVYCDPPYLMSTRSGRRLYKNEMTVGQHAELLAVIKRLPGPGAVAESGGRARVVYVAISGYASPLYSAELQDWRCISFNAMTRGGRVAREHLWMNYPEPAELHDYRYLGDEKRERERVTRKVRTWAAGLQRLPSLERQAILASILTRESGE